MRTRSKAWGGLTLTLVTVAACRPQSAPPIPSSPEASLGPSPAMKPDHLGARGPTTSAEIALQNLEAEVAQLEGRLPEHTSVDERLQLISLYQHRAQVLGGLEDDERAIALAEALVAAHPENVDALQAHARVRARMHRFEEAEADLAAAAAAGADVTYAQARLQEEVEPSDHTLAAIEKQARDWPRYDHLAALAAALGRRGRHAEADAYFQQAWSAYRDVSPFIAAWLEFQDGLHHERMRDLEGNHDSWRRAWRRAPMYAAAAAHLAELEVVRGSPELAVFLVEHAYAQTKDPEYGGQLSALLRGTDPSRSAELLAAAKAGWSERVSRHPLAFADHAARFWMGAGDHLALALELAHLNLDNRRTPEARALLLEVAMAAGELATACDQLQALGKLAALELTNELRSSAETVCQGR